MALVSGRGGGGSTLNPNAPLYIPTCILQVEDFSPEWWNLVTTSTWFKDYWLSHNQVEDFSGSDEEEVIIDLLPDSVDYVLDEDLLNFESHLEEFFSSCEAVKENMAYFFAAKKLPKNGDVDEMVKSLMISSKGRGPRYGYEPMKHLQNPGKRMSPKCSPRCIQQPR